MREGASGSKTMLSFENPHGIWSERCSCQDLDLEGPQHGRSSKFTWLFFGWSLQHLFLKHHNLSLLVQDSLRHFYSFSDRSRLLFSWCHRAWPERDSSLRSWDELLDKRLLLRSAEGECTAAGQRWLQYDLLLVKKTTYPQVECQGPTARSDPLSESDFRIKQSKWSSWLLDKQLSSLPWSKNR